MINTSLPCQYRAGPVAVAAASRSPRYRSFVGMRRIGKTCLILWGLIMYIMDTTFSITFPKGKSLWTSVMDRLCATLDIVWNKCEYYHCRKFATLSVSALLCVNMVFPYIDGMYYEQNSTMGEIRYKQNGTRGSYARITSSLTPLPGNGKKSGPHQTVDPSEEELETWHDYSLGDLVLIPQSTFSQDHKNHKDNVCGRHPRSIGCRYISSPSYSVNNLTLLNSVTDAMILENSYTLPPPWMTVIHIRLGDVLNPALVEPPTNDCFATSCVFRPNGGNYTYPRSYYENVLEEGQIRPPHETTIAVVGFSHHFYKGGNQADREVSTVYRSNMISFFRSANYSVTKSSSGDRVPDMDFAYLCNARTIVPGGGNYARLVEDMVKRKGGKSVRGRPGRRLKLPS